MILLILINLHIKKIFKNGKIKIRKKKIAITIPKKIMYESDKIHNN